MTRQRRRTCRRPPCRCALCPHHPLPNSQCPYCAPAGTHAQDIAYPVSPRPRRPITSRHVSIIRLASLSRWSDPRSLMNLLASFERCRVGQWSDPSWILDQILWGCSCSPIHISTRTHSSTSPMSQWRQATHRQCPQTTGMYVLFHLGRDTSPRQSTLAAPL